MRISQRLLILFLVIALAFAGFFYLFLHIKQEEQRIYAESDQNQRRTTIDTIFQMNVDSHLALLKDYSLWDDLVLFTKSRDERWADENLATLIPSFSYSLVQVYDTNHNLVYSVSDESVTELENYLISPEVLDSLATKRLLYYRTRHGSTILANAIATIHGTVDLERKTSPAGYLLLSHAWDYRYLGNLAKSLNYDVRISLSLPPLEKNTSEQYNTRISKAITNLQGENIAWLVFYSSNPFLAQLRALGNLIIFGTAGFILVFLVVQFVLIQTWITVPLKLISQSLKENNPRIISSIDNHDDEFSNIASLIERFFAQKQELVSEIEERQRTEDKLREIEEQTSKILLTSPESIIVTDLQGHILKANQETLRLVAVDKESDLTSRHASILELALPENHPKLLRLIGELHTRALIKNMELDLIDARGEKFPALLSAAVITDADNNPARLVFITRDISELKSLEIKLRQSQKMESIGTLAGGIAHDFNNIITIIAGYIALSAGKIDNYPEARDDLDEALKACLRAKSLIGKILTFSRQTEVKVQPIVLADVIEDTIPMIRASIPTKVSIVSDIVSFSYTIADPTEMQQVLMNLSSNSYHAMRPDGGTLAIKLDEVHGFELIGFSPDVRLETDYLHLSVSDTGRGIPSDIINRIFDPYFSTKPIGEGTGLGLSIVHGIITAYDGFINVESTPGEACTFNIYLPVHDHVETIPISEPPKEYPFIPACIIMVDDEPALAELFSTVLREEGYEVMSFSSSTSALRAYASSPSEFDLVIADITMPDLDGIQLAARMREIKPVPIILYTGFCDKNIQIRAENISVNKLLNKPLLPNELVREVKELLFGLNNEES